MNDRFAAFIAARQAEVYEEPRTAGHDFLTDKMATEVEKLLPKGGSVLDVGCGQGPALDWFHLRGFNVCGTSLCESDMEICRASGHDVIRCDQMDLDMFPGRVFDLVWARHVLEHAVAPFWVLSEFARVLRVGGILYAEMPAPDTACNHPSNRNHYSVLGQKMWAQLISRSGFEILNAGRLELKTPAGPDCYLFFTARKL